MNGVVDAPRPAVSGTSIVPCDMGRILVADDEPAIVRVFGLVLSMRFPDLAVDTAPDGRAALDLFSEHHHGVILLDVRMPVMDGEEAYRAMERLCSERKWAMPTVVFCTGFTLPETLRHAVARHCHYVIEKPVSEELLLQSVRLGLGRTDL